MTVKDEIERLQKLLAKATPGPWDEQIVADIWRSGFGAETQKPGVPYAQMLVDIFDRQTDKDAALVVAAVNALPDLLARILALEAENAELLRLNTCLQGRPLWGQQ